MYSAEKCIKTNREYGILAKHYMQCVKSLDLEMLFHPEDTTFLTEVTTFCSPMIDLITQFWMDLSSKSYLK